jgi:hypothetical protein
MGVILSIYQIGAHVGIKLDPGNNYAQEGYEDFTYQIHLLKEYIQAFGAKDACSLRISEI